MENRKDIIQIENLRKTYIMGAERIDALKTITLNIKSNEYVALMGPSGSGKSTLMNLLGCLDTPSEGDYLLNGTNEQNVIFHVMEHAADLIANADAEL